MKVGSVYLALVVAISLLDEERRVFDMGDEFESGFDGYGDNNHGRDDEWIVVGTVVNWDSIEQMLELDGHNWCISTTVQREIFRLD